MRPVRDHGPRAETAESACHVRYGNGVPVRSILVRIAVTGSIATDHLMSFDGHFAENLVTGQDTKISVSFLVTDLRVRRGGVAANIAFGLAGLGLRPLLVGAVGPDFDEYRIWLETAGVDCSGVLVDENQHTARFMCTTDRDEAQIASFYAGAMTTAREIALAPLLAEGVDLVLVSPNDPEAMIRHTRECLALGVPFAADPSQQLAWSDGERVRELVDGARFLFSNDYEAELIRRKTGWTDADVLARVGVRVTTHGADGVVIDSADGTRITVPVVPARQVADPTGVGDAFRSGFLSGLSWGLDLATCAQVGSTLATQVIETVGCQDYTVDPEGFLARLGATYGDEAAALVRPHLVAVAGVVASHRG